MAKKSPLQLVTDEFGGKDKLVDKLVGLLESDQSKDDLRKSLLPVSNTKLLKLHRTASILKEKFGSRDKLLSATADALGRSKDKDYVSKLDGMSSGRLLDIAAAAARRKKRLDATKPAAK